MTTTLAMFGQNWEIDGVPDLLEKLAQSADPSWKVYIPAKPVHSFHLTHADFGTVEVTSNALAAAIEELFGEIKNRVGLLFMEYSPYREIINFVHTGDASEVYDVTTIGDLLEACAKAAYEQRGQRREIERVEETLDETEEDLDEEDHPGPWTGICDADYV